MNYEGFWKNVYTFVKNMFYIYQYHPILLVSLREFWNKQYRNVKNVFILNKNLI